MRRVGSPAAEVVRVDRASPETSFRELDDVFLQRQTRIWLGEVLHLRFDEEMCIADLLADGELLFQVSKVVWKMLLKKNLEQLKKSKVYIYERTSFGKSNGRYMPYPKVDSFLKICQILGLTGVDLFTPSDVVEKRDVRRVCMCIRSLSKKARLKSLNVPDFDIVTYTIAMPTYIVGGICKSLEQSQCSSSSSNGYSPQTSSKELSWQRTSAGHHDEHDDTHYDSDEAESKLNVLEYQSQLSDAILCSSSMFDKDGENPHEDSFDEDSYSMFFHPSNAPQMEHADHEESGHDIYCEEASIAESMESNYAGMNKGGCADSTFVTYDQESSTSTRCQPDQYSMSTCIVCPLSLEKSASLGSDSAIEIRRNDLDAKPAANAEGNCEGHAESAVFFHSHGTQLCSSHIILDQAKQVDGKRFAGDPAKGTNDIQNDNDNIESQSVCVFTHVSHCEYPRCSCTPLSGANENVELSHKACYNGAHCSNNKLKLVEKYDAVGNHLICDDLVDLCGDKSETLDFRSTPPNGAPNVEEFVGSGSEEVSFGSKREPLDWIVSSEAFSEVISTPTSIDSKPPIVSEDNRGGNFLLPESHFCNVLRYSYMEISPTECVLSSCSPDTITADVHSIEKLEGRELLTLKSFTPSSEEEGSKNSSIFEKEACISSDSRKPADCRDCGTEQASPCQENVAFTLNGNLSIGRWVLNEMHAANSDHNISQSGSAARTDDKGLCRGPGTLFAGGTSENDKNNFFSGGDALCASNEPDGHSDIVHCSSTVEASSHSGFVNFAKQAPKKMMSRASRQYSAEGDTSSTVPLSCSLPPHHTCEIVHESLDQGPIDNTEVFQNHSLEIVDSTESLGRNTLSLEVFGEILADVIPSNTMTEFKDKNGRDKEFTPEHEEVQGDGTAEQLTEAKHQLVPQTGNDSSSRKQETEYITHSKKDATQCEDEPVKLQHTTQNDGALQSSTSNVHKSGKGVLKSVAGGITLAGAVFFILHLRRSRERNFATFLPSQSRMSTQDSRPENIEKGKAPTVYPGEWLKV